MEKADDIAGTWLFLPKGLSLNEEQKQKADDIVVPGYLCPSNCG